MAPRSPSRSSDGGRSDHHVRAEPRLLKAIEDKKNDEAIAIIEHAKAQSQPSEHLLRIGLMRAAERGNSYIAEYLLKSGAKPDGAPGARVSPLLRAIEKNHVGIVQLLLKFGGNVDVADKQGRTALTTAAWQNLWHIVNELLRWGADVNKKDSKGRNVLHNLAADKYCNWGRDVIDLLLRTNIAIDGPDGQDDSQRTPLHWAASTGKKELCEMLLTRPKMPRANVNAVEVREKTPLHLAVTHGRDDIVELLLHYGADVKAKSDGSWTALHNACDQGSVKNVRMLLAAGAELNGRLLNGMTPLHQAAQAGHVDVVQCLLERKDLKRAARDAFGVTPFLRAAQSKKKDIVNMLAPSNHVDTLSEDALGASNGFNATIVDFGMFHNGNKVTRRSVFELLYGRDPVNPRKPAFNILPKESKATDFRWIHLPANNMAWVEALHTKAFIEEGASDVEGFKAMERSFNHQHRGQQIHSHYMRPLCQSTPRAPRQQDDSELSDNADQGPPQIVVSMGAGLGINTTGGAQDDLPHPPKTPARTGTVSTDQTDWTIGTAGSSSTKERGMPGKGKEKPKKMAKWAHSRKASGRSGGTDTPTKYTDQAPKRKFSTPLQNSQHLRSPGSPGRRDPTQVAKGNIFMFMPYLHFETNRKRQEMQEAIDRAQIMRDRNHGGRHVHTVLQRATTYDEMLLRAHLTSSTVSLHVRRTLDQFFYHNIDTRSRDEDQVVYRYQCRGSSPEKSGVDPKVFMVDQLWLVCLGKDLIVTAFPQRWQQPKNDPLNVLDGIIEDINSKTRDPVRSVYDLAMLITARCEGVFDRHRMGDEDYQFLDMFESSIGDATEMETVLFKEFNVASAQASAWLQHHRLANRFSRHLDAEVRINEHRARRGIAPHTHDHALANPPTHETHYTDPSAHHTTHQPLFVDQLLDIGAETDLLAEIKDIRDELNMIAKVLEDQRAVLPDLEASITDIYRDEHKTPQSKWQKDLQRRFKEQLKTLDTHLKDLERMDKQAERIYYSITDLLDLKQKHANAFEARFARDQATNTTRQSQTIMVFTIVTIIFLPLSFIAAMFTINIREFPHQPGSNEPSLPLNYVAKYTFGIGFAISLPLIAVALNYDALGDFFREHRMRWRDRRGRSREDRGGGRAGMDARHTNLSATFSNAAHTNTHARPSIESYLDPGSGGAGSLLPVTSRTTARSRGEDKDARNGTNGAVNGGLGDGSQRPVPVERMSTGFRMRRSADVERGVGV